MKDITNKLITFKDNLLTEKSGTLYFVGLIQRIDFENKWDLLIIADWIKENNSYADLEYVLISLKELFNDDLSFLQDVVLYKSEYEFTLELKAADLKNPVSILEFSKMRVWEYGSINVIAIHNELSKLPETVTEPTVSYAVTDF